MDGDESKDYGKVHGFDDAVLYEGQHPVAVALLQEI